MRSKISQWFMVYGLAALAILLLIAGWAHHVVLGRTARNESLVTHTYEVLRVADQVLIDLVDAETGQRGFLLSHDRQFLEPYLRGKRDVSVDLAKLRDLVSDNHTQIKRVQLAENVSEAKLRELEQTIDLGADGSAPTARAVVLSGKGKLLMDQLRLIIAQINTEELGLLQHRSLQTARSFRTLSIIVWTMSLTSAALTLLLLYRVVDVARLQARLIESEYEFRTLSDTIPQLAWIAKPDGWIYWYNRRWYEYTGTEPKDMEGWGWQSVHDPQTLPAVLAEWKESIATGRPFDMTFPLKGADGQFRPFLTRVLPFLDGNGNVIRWFGTNTDMSAPVQVEEALRKSEKLAAVGRIAASMAHEINNPLESIANLLYLIKRDPEIGAVSRDRLVMVDKEIERVANLTRQTLGFSRDSHSATWFDPSTTVDDVVALYLHKLRSRDISIQKEARTSAPLLAHAGEFRQVFANLFVNAIDSMPAGGRIMIRVRAAVDWLDHEKTGVRITVADTGVGIARDQFSRIFEPFYTTKQEVGNGLGLWLSRSIVEKRGGRIRMRSREHCGTIFSVFWPYEQGGTSATGSPNVPLP